MIVIDWTPNGQGGFFANVLLDEKTSERWVWNGSDDCYDLLVEPNGKPEPSKQELKRQIKVLKDLHNKHCKPIIERAERKKRGGR